MDVCKQVTDTVVSMLPETARNFRGYRNLAAYILTRDPGYAPPEIKLKDVREAVNQLDTGGVWILVQNLLSLALADWERLRSQRG